MNLQTDPVSQFKNRIVRQNERIVRWNKESDGVEALWGGGLAYKRFCQGMADNADEKRQQLQVELELLEADQGS